MENYNIVPVPDNPQQHNTLLESVICSLPIANKAIPINELPYFGFVMSEYELTYYEWLILLTSNSKIIPFINEYGLSDIRISINKVEFCENQFKDNNKINHYIYDGNNELYLAYLLTVEVRPYTESRLIIKDFVLPHKVWDMVKNKMLIRL